MATLVQNATRGLCMETDIKRTGKPRRGWGQRWRWDVTFYREAEGIHPGVLDSRTHLTGSWGYTWTFWGACLAAGRTVRDRDLG